MSAPLYCHNSTHRENHVRNQERGMNKTLRLFTFLLVVMIALVSCNNDPASQIIEQKSPTIRG